MPRRLDRAALLAACMVLFGCPKSQEAARPDHHGPHWAYEGEAGPASWGHLAPEFASCGEGQAQSPVDLPAEAQSISKGALELALKPSALHLVNNGHTIQQNMDPGDTLTLDGATYRLAQFHLHHPSEHSVGGKHFPLEIHLVHKDDAGHLAVVGVLVEAGAENAALAPLFANLPAHEGETVDKAETQLDPAAFLPADRTFFRYPGSLTTPPCTEGVRWQVLKTPITASEAQLDRFSALFADDSRPVQATSGRTVELVSP